MQYSTTALVATGLALYTAWDLTLVTLATVPVGALFLAWISKRIQPAIRHQMEELSNANIIAVSAMRFIETVKCFNGQEFEFHQYVAAVKKAAMWYIVQAKTNSIQIGFTRLLVLVLFVQGFYYGSYLVETGKKSSGQVLTGFWACLMATQTFEQILPQVLVLERGKTAAVTLQSVLTKLDKVRRLREVHGGRTPPYLDGDIRIKDVCPPFTIW